MMLCGNCRQYLGSALSFIHLKKLVSRLSYFRVEEKHSHFIPHMVLFRQSSYHANTICIPINCWARACPESASQPYLGLCGFSRQRFLGQAARAQRALACRCDTLLALSTAWLSPGDSTCALSALSLPATVPNPAAAPRCSWKGLALAGTALLLHTHSAAASPAQCVRGWGWEIGCQGGLVPPCASQTRVTLKIMLPCSGEDLL